MVSPALSPESTSMSSPTLAPTVTSRTSNPPSGRGTKTTRLRFSSCTATCGIRRRSTAHATCRQLRASKHPGFQLPRSVRDIIRTSTVRVVSETVAPMSRRPETGRSGNASTFTVTVSPRLMSRIAVSGTLATNHSVERSASRTARFRSDWCTNRGVSFDDRALDGRSDRQQRGRWTR